MMKKKKSGIDGYSLAGVLISLAGMIVLIVCFDLWFSGRPKTNWGGFISAALMATLFEVFFARTVFHWTDEWRALRPPKPKPKHTEHTDAASAEEIESDGNVPETAEADVAEPAAEASSACACDRNTAIESAGSCDCVQGAVTEPAEVCNDATEDAITPDAAAAVTEDANVSVAEISDAPAVAAVQEQPADVLRAPDAPLHVPVFTMIKIFLCALVAAAAGLFIVYVFQIVKAGGEPRDFWSAAQIWGKLDSAHFFDIARDWYLSEGEYGRVVQLVFLPGFPLVLRAVTALTGNYLLSGILVSCLSFAGGCVMLYRLTRLDADHATALRAVKFAMLLPGAFFMASPMSDAMFFLLSVSCMYCIRRKRWLLVGLLGAIATFTRSLGLALLVPAFYSVITEIFATAGKGLTVKKVLRFTPVLLVPAGFIAYCFICWQVSGNPFQFMIYEKDNWGQAAGYFFNTAAYQFENAMYIFDSFDWRNLFGLWIPNLFACFSSLAVMALSAKKQSTASNGYFFAYYIVAVGVTWLISAPRYMAACFPICIGLASITGKRKYDTAVTVSLTVIYVLYAAMMANRWQVW